MQFLVGRPVRCFPSQVHVPCPKVIDVWKTLGKHCTDVAVHWGCLNTRGPTNSKLYHTTVCSWLKLACIIHKMKAWLFKLKVSLVNEMLHFGMHCKCTQKHYIFAEKIGGAFHYKSSSHFVNKKY